MKRITICLMMFITTAFVPQAGAALHDRGGGLIYDDILDITWMQNANYYGETMTWDEAVTWGSDLVFQGYDDWRLPDADSLCTGKSCSGSEMGHLFYNDNVTFETPGLFSDIRNYMYWTGTEDPGNNSNALRFSFKYGTQDDSPKTTTRYVWVVRDGDSSPPVAPEPLSSVLFIAGGAILSAGRLKKIVPFS